MKKLTLSLFAACCAVAVLSAVASYPTATKSFTTKNAGDTIQPAHINDIQDEIVAIENALLGTMQHHAKVASGFYFFADGRATGEGVWASPAHADSNYTGDATDANWVVDAGDVTTMAYTRVGDTMSIAATIVSTDVAAAPSELRITLPASAILSGRPEGVCRASDAGGTQAAVICYGVSGETTIRIAKFSGAWTTTSSDNTAVYVLMTFPIQ